MKLQQRIFWEGGLANNPCQKPPIELQNPPCDSSKLTKYRTYLTSCTIFKNGLEARSLRSGFLVEWAREPVPKKLIEHDARSQTYVTSL
jgi:hypothetical protein